MESNKETPRFEDLPFEEMLAQFLRERKQQRRTMEKKDEFLEVFNSLLNISKTCKTIGINRDTFYAWCKNDPEFVRRYRQK